MYIRLLKAAWFFFLIGFMAFFMYIYVALPSEIVVSSTVFSFTTTKEIFFYTSLFTVLPINMLAFMPGNSFLQGHTLKIFILGQLITLNFFFAMLLITLLFINSGGQYNLNSIGTLLYGSVAIVIAWALGGLVYFMVRHINR